MIKVLIACEDAPSVQLHTFFESCSDDARQFCCDNKASYTLIRTPDMTQEKVIEKMIKHQLCFVAAHGKKEGICNEKDEDVISTQTVNYNFNGKGFYSVSCYCAQKLYPELRQKGLKFFIGYNEEFVVRNNPDIFKLCAMSGFNALISGHSLKESKDEMYHVFDEKIDEANNSHDIFTAADLLKDKESLDFEGDDDLKLSDLK